MSFQEILPQNLVSDEWLSSIFEYPVFRLATPAGWFEKAKQRRYLLLEGLPSAKVFIYTKVSTDSLHELRFLEESGFRLVDTAVTFEKNVSDHPSFAGNCSLRWARPEDENQVADLAGRCFRYSRFHLDPVVPKSLADKIKSEWARNYFAGQRGQQMVVSLRGDAMIGFTQLLYPDDQTIVIDLIAVDASERGRGVAADMIAYAESKSGKFSKIRVGTQIANVASARLYEKIGFRLINSQYVLHYHGLSRGTR